MHKEMFMIKEAGSKNKPYKVSWSIFDSDAITKDLETCCGG